MKITIKPRFAAQIEITAVHVKSGACGFRIVHEGEKMHESVHAQDRVGETPIWFSDAQEAYRIMYSAQCMTEIMMNKVFGK